MWCPEGHGEFQPHISNCIDCGVSLIEQEPPRVREPEPAPTPEPTVPVEVLLGVGRRVDPDEVGLLLRAEGIDHFWAADDLVVPCDRVEDVRRTLAGVGPPVRSSTSPSAVVRRAMTFGPKARAFFVWAPAIAALWYGAAALGVKLEERDAPPSEFWKALSVFAGGFIVIGALTLRANWAIRFHRRASWILLSSMVLLAVTALV